MRARNENELKYEDIRVNALQVNLAGSSSAPDLRQHDLGISSGVNFTMLAFAVTNYIDFYIETPHKSKLDIIMDCHMHFTLPTSDPGKKIKFQVDLATAGLDASFAVPTGSPFTKEYDIVGNEDTKHVVCSIANIPASNPTISSLYIGKFKRIAASIDEYQQEVYLQFIDFHCRVDDRGSTTNNQK